MHQHQPECYSGKNQDGRTSNKSHSNMIASGVMGLLPASMLARSTSDIPKKVATVSRLKERDTRSPEILAPILQSNSPRLLLGGLIT